jgi:hypothetical protein
MWEADHNPVSQRQCEILLHASVGVRPMPTMQIGVIAGRAIAFGRRLANRGTAPSVMQRGEVLEVYPRATLRRLSDGDERLRPRVKGESPAEFRGRVLVALGDRIDGLDHQPALLADGHAFDALIAAYTAWHAPDGLEPPPEGFNLASGWIWFPRRVPATGADAAAG